MNKLHPNQLITNEEYQTVLNEVYGENIVQPLVRVHNTKSIVVHKCHACGVSFFAMPHLLVNKEHQKHVCGKNNGVKGVHNQRKSKAKGKKESQKDKEEREALAQGLLALEAGYSVQEVTEEFDIAASVLVRWAKQLGIKISKERKHKNSVTA